MLIKAKIIEVEMRTHKGKEVADVSFKTTNPTEMHISTMWSNSVEKGEHKPFAHLAGSVCEFAVRVEEFNGKVQLNINGNVLPQVVEHIEAGVVPRAAAVAK